MIIERDWIYLDCNPQQAKKLDAVWVKSRGKYRLPNTLGALRELKDLGFDVASVIYKKSKAREMLLDKKNSVLCPGYDERLRKYQRQDIFYLQKVAHPAIFNEPRTGKTPTTLKLIESMAFGDVKVVIICPASLVLNWDKEVRTWTDYPVISVSGTKKKREKIYNAWNSNKGCLVLSKDTAKVDYDLIDTTDCVLVVDEAHFLRNHRTAQSKAIFHLGKKAAKRIALTGTPATNHPKDVWGILHFLYPDRFSSYWQFIDRYFKTWDAPWGSREVGKLKREQEFTEILELISVQRKRKDIMKWIPKKQYQTIELEMDKKQRKAYDEMITMFTVEEAGVDAPSLLAQITRLRQICLAPEVLGIQAPSAKEKFIMEWLDDNPNTPVVIFSNFSSYLVRLQRKIKGSKLVIGETSKQDRQKAVEELQAGEIKVILANIEAAGTGLTLDNAETVIFLDRHYNPGFNEQAEDRIVPTTEDSNLNTLVIDLVCNDSIDKKINDILKRKNSVIEVVNNYKNIRELMK